MLAILFNFLSYTTLEHIPMGATAQNDLKSDRPIITKLRIFHLSMHTG